MWARKEKMLNSNNISLARSQHLHGRGVHGCFRHLIPSAAGESILPQEILKKWVILDSISYFMQFEDSLLGNKAGKSEGH